MRVKPGKQNPEIAPSGCVKSRCASFVPADDSALSATAQTLDYRVTPLIYSRSILSCTGTTGSVVRCGESRARRPEKRAREAARSDGLLLDSYRRPDEFYRLKYSMLEERLEQVREIDGELAYEKMRRAVPREGQPRRRLGKRRLGKWRAGRSAVGRNAAARSGTMAPAASLVLLRGRERMGRTDWEEA